MSKTNPLVGLLGQYGSDDDSDEEMSKSSKIRTDLHSYNSNNRPPSAPLPPEPVVNDGSIHPSPVTHCPWSACYDESSGYTYYWNQHTNAVTWEAPPEYLLALKLAQQQLNVAGSAEVTAEEWQLYQQALAEKELQKAAPKPPSAKVVKAPEITKTKHRNGKQDRKKRNSDSEEEKIELITSYYNSDSESNDEESPTKIPPVPTEPKPPTPPPPLPKNGNKKQKTKSVEYGPSLPPNQNYTVPIGPEIPPELVKEVVEEKIVVAPPSPKESKSSPKPLESEDDDTLLTKLKDKAKLLEKLGGEIPKELINLIKEEKSESDSVLDEKKEVTEMNIDDLLDEIEKKELPKAKSSKIDNQETLEETTKEIVAEVKTATEKLVAEPKSLFPSAVNIDESETIVQEKPKDSEEVLEKRGANIYLADVEHAPAKKKLRISNSVLPERKTSDVPSYTTKYSQFVEGFSGERAGLGFSKGDEETEAPKKAIQYGKGLMFTKGETLNEKDESLEDDMDLLEAKLKFLNQEQAYQVSPVQEMAIQMQTLVCAHRSSAVDASYFRRWLGAAAAALSRLERAAAPAGWLCRFHRESGRYEYKRESDGHTQWDYPTAAVTTAASGGADDMDICTTPPHLPEYKNVQIEVPPPLPAEPPPPPPPARTPPPPPPPLWGDPPPPGCDDPPLPPPPPTITVKPKESKKEIGDELLSFYNDIAELEKVASPTVSTSNSPDRPLEREKLEISTPPPPKIEKEKEPKRKKTKVKISSTVGLKHKTVSSLVAKWQQVAEEIHSD